MTTVFCIYVNALIPTCNGSEHFSGLLLTILKHLKVRLTLLLMFHSVTWSRVHTTKPSLLGEYSYAVLLSAQLNLVLVCYGLHSWKL